jgi:DNA (cytosine-5)-methyltransferase 1
MRDVEALPWNGYNVVSTFSGCGGSCLGYRMAGYRVLWANEFVPAAQETYAANHPTSILDKRDIREVRPEDILEATGLTVGQLDLFDGSPPCSSFSTAGKRDKGWGEVKAYSDVKQRTDDLFYQYVRLLAGLRPKVFVAENVSGLVKGVAKGYFLAILRAMKEAGYNVTCRVLDAQWLGVPQARQRTIFVGVREDLGIAPAHPEPLPYRYALKEVLPLNEGETVIHDASGTFQPPIDLTNRPSNTITNNPWHYFVEREAWLDGYATGEEYDKLREGEASERYFSLVRADSEKPSPTIQASHGSPGIAGVSHPRERRKFSIEELKVVCSFPHDFILTGSFRQQWERLGRSVPPLMMKRIAETIRDRVLSQVV